MNEEVKILLNQIISNQVVIFKRLEEIECKIKGSMRSASAEHYVKDLRKEANKYLPFLEK